MLIESDCVAEGGIYMGDGIPCDPNPCATPIEKTTWGQIKATFR